MVEVHSYWISWTSCFTHKITRIRLTDSVSNVSSSKIKKKSCLPMDNAPIPCLTLDLGRNRKTENKTHTKQEAITVHRNWDSKITLELFSST